MYILGKGQVRGGFHISNYVVCIQSCDGSRGGYIIQSGDFPILYYFCITGNQRMSFIHTLKSQTIMPKSLTCDYSIYVPDTFVVEYHTVPTHY